VEHGAGEIHPAMEKAGLRLSRRDQTASSTEITDLGNTNISRMRGCALARLGYEPDPVAGKGGGDAGDVNRYGRASGLPAVDEDITVDVINQLRTNLAALPVEDLSVDVGREKRRKPGTGVRAQGAGLR